MNVVYKTTGLFKSNIGHYCLNTCYVCGSKKCENKVFDYPEKCAKYNPSKPIEEWWIELKKVVYENETPWQDGNGGVDENSDATSEMLEMLNTNETDQMNMIECWAIGDSPKEAFDYWLETMN